MKEKTIKVSLEKVDEMVENFVMATELGADIVINDDTDKIIILQALVYVRDGLKEIKDIQKIKSPKELLN